MIYGIYAVRDVKAGFMTPTVDLSDNTAARNFSHAIKTSDSVFASFAKDFDLFRIGSYDTDTGEILPSKPEHVISGSDAQVL